MQWIFSSNAANPKSPILTFPLSKIIFAGLKKNKKKNDIYKLKTLNLDGWFHFHEYKQFHQANA